MNGELYLANYLLALSNNTMTEETRQKLVDNIDYENEEECKRVFISVLKAILDAVVKENVYATEDAKALAQSEISSLCLFSLCGNEEVFGELVGLLLGVTSEEVSENMDERNMIFCKSFIELADNMSDDFKYDIYVTVLRFMVAKFYVLNDKNLTSKIVTYVDSVCGAEKDIGYTGLFSNIILYVLHRGFEE